MSVPIGKEHQIEERPCPTCGGIVKLYRDQDGGLLFAAPGASLLQQDRDEARRELAAVQTQAADAADEAARAGYRAGYAEARQRFSLNGRLLDLVMKLTNPAYRKQEAARGRP